MSAITSVPQSERGDPVWEIAELFPRQGEWTEEDYLALDTNRLVEFVDGCLEVLPVPDLVHQGIVKHLFRTIDAFINAAGRKPLGEVFFAPAPIRLWKGRLREPDLAFFMSGRITDRRDAPDGADLVVEVLSPGEKNRHRDLVVKRREYAKAKISEYWIVDPEQKTVEVLVLKRRTYVPHGVFGVGQSAVSVLLPGLSVSVAETMASGQGRRSPN